jgi:hypothetical protein
VSIARENPGARRRRNFWLGECKEFKLKSKKKFAADGKIFPARRKKTRQRKDFLPQALEFYTGSEQLVYSLFTTTGNSLARQSVVFEDYVTSLTGCEAVTVV